MKLKLIPALLASAFYLSVAFCANIAVADTVAVGTAAVDKANSSTENWNLHAQATYVKQKHGSFNSPYQGQNSLLPEKEIESTADITLYAGVRLWQGAEFYLNEELDQGFGVSNTLGTAGFLSGEAYKVGAHRRYFRTPRAFFRQTINLGGEQTRLDSAANQLAGKQTANNIIITAGKFSIVDIFDTNRYAHDPRTDFLNWSIIDAGAFDYAADAWGYTEGVAAEWTQSWWTLRGGVFDLSNVPNSSELDSRFHQLAFVTEIEQRHEWNGHPGKIKLLGFANHGKFGSYHDAVRIADENGAIPDMNLLRQYSYHSGLVLNSEEEFADNIGEFVRVSVNEGEKESYDFTDINRSFSAGLVLSGNIWQRANDKIGFAFAVNQLSSDAINYFKRGGLGILIGDGNLRYAPEKIAETYYLVEICKGFSASLDLQRINNPAYNKERGPVHAVALRLHVEY